MEIRAKCRKLKLEKNIGLVVIDYLQLVQGSNKKGGSREQEISEISRSLKILAKEINVPVIALSQLSRAPEQRPDHRPMLSDLRESGAIEQDADIVMFLYRDDYYNEDSEKKNIAEVIIAKHRAGSTELLSLLGLEIILNLLIWRRLLGFCKLGFEAWIGTVRIGLYIKNPILTGAPFLEWCELLFTLARGCTRFLVLYSFQTARIGFFII